ncbi:cache domain-containing protein [Geitlerinema sp. CS-897]|nr:cache domain-containing protein [Geitlerinema sp. CS-897]
MQTNKTSQAHTRHFQRYLVAASALGIFLVSAIVAAVAVFPLSRQLKVEARRELKFSAQTRVFTVEELLSRLQSIAMQITSRTRARQVLEAYDRGEIDRSEFVTTSQRILTDALNQSEEVVGITRLNEEGNLAVSVGREIPRSWWVVPPATAQTSLVRDPVTLSGQSYLVVGAPILNSNGQRVGTDVVLFDVSRLREIVDDRTGLGETGTTALGTWRNDRVELFFSQYDEVADLALQTAVERAVTDGESGTQIVPGDTAASGGVRARRSQHLGSGDRDTSSGTLRTDLSGFNSPQLDDRRRHSPRNWGDGFTVASFRSAIDPTSEEVRTANRGN